MPIVLIKEDGTGVADANTYVEVSDVDTYATNHGYVLWVGDDDLKAAAILRGMNYIESYSFKGRKTDRDQALKWPRIEARDEDNYLLDCDYIPTKLLAATCESAYRELVNPNNLQADTDVGVKKKKVDFLETEYFQSGNSNTTSFTIIQHLLSGYIENATSIPLSRT